MARVNAFAGTSAYCRRFRPGIPAALTAAVADALTLFANRGVLTEDNAFTVLTAHRLSAHEGR